MSNILFLFPNNVTARCLALRLLKLGHKITFYLPEANDQSMTEDILTELDIFGQDSDHTILTIFVEIQTNRSQ